MRSLGVRAKLSLLAVGLMTILYLLLGVTVFVVARETILTSIDSGLKKMGEGFQHQHNHPPDDPGGPDGDGWHHHHRDFPGDDHPPDNPPGPPDSPNFQSQGPRPNPAQPPLGPRHAIEPVDIHDGRPKVVWKQSDAPFPFPESSPVDAGAVLVGRKGGTLLRTITFDDEPIRVYTIPVVRYGTNQVNGVVQMSYWLGDVYRVLNTLAGTLLLILPVGIFVMGWGSMVVIGKTLQPVRDIRTAAAKIEAEDLSGRLPAEGKDEFAELAETMNGMLQRLDSAFSKQRLTLDQLREVIQQQRRFTADASHELKTPLAVVKVNASLLKSSLAKDPDGLEMLSAVDQAANRMSKLVQDLLLLARTDSGQLGEQFEPLDLVSSAKKALGLVTCRDRVTLEAPSEPVWLCGSSFALERLITNLLDNACRHTGSEGSIRLKIALEGETVLLAVADTGEGIPESHLPKIFERFHRVDDSRHSGTGGTGLGLAICKGIVEAHHGTISVESELGKGTTFTVRMPRGFSEDAAS